MKNKKIIWYGGYVAAELVILIIAVTDLSEAADAGLGVLFSVLFSVSHISFWHDKMMEKNKDYRIEVRDERNITIKEKAGNVINMINMTLLGVNHSGFYSFGLHNFGNLYQSAAGYPAGDTDSGE